MESTPKEYAITLRQQGLTYTEISKIIPVSKATLSGWLSSVSLPYTYHEKIRRLRIQAREKGCEARRNERISRTEHIRSNAEREAKTLVSDPFWVMGLTLYWAEGSKEKAWGRGVPITFTNMDVDTIRIFKNWCERFLHVKEDDFQYSVYIHDTQKENTCSYVEWWAEKLRIDTDSISTYYKRSKVSHVRKNDREGYRGVFRLQVRRSVDANRLIGGWISGMIRSL